MTLCNKNDTLVTCKMCKMSNGLKTWNNTLLIFCNFGGSREYYGKKSGSGFLQGGRDLIFNVKLQNYHGKSSERTLFDFISSKNGTDLPDKKILLFARDGTRKKYTYCGHCECQSFIEKDCGSVALLLNLLDFNELVDEDKASSDFTELVETYTDNEKTVFAWNVGSY